MQNNFVREGTPIAAPWRLNVSPRCSKPLIPIAVPSRFPLATPSIYCCTNLTFRHWSSLIRANSLHVRLQDGFCNRRKHGPGSPIHNRTPGGYRVILRPLAIQRGADCGSSLTIFVSVPFAHRQVIFPRLGSRKPIRPVHVRSLSSISGPCAGYPFDQVQLPGRFR